MSSYQPFKSYLQQAVLKEFIDQLPGEGGYDNDDPNTVKGKVTSVISTLTNTLQSLRHVQSIIRQHASQSQTPVDETALLYIENEIDMVETAIAKLTTILDELQ